MKLYHYTSLASFLGIIREGRKLVFWGSRYDCMNDPLDFQFAKIRILPTLKKVAHHPDLLDNEKIEVEVEPYIVSFSTKEDDFLMWRMYNSKVALVLDSEYFDRPTPNTSLIKCQYTDYNNDEILNAFKMVNKTLTSCRNIFAYASRGATFIKHKSFESEGEVRLATWDYYKDCNKLILSDCKDDDEKEVKTRMANNDKIVLYKEFEIDGNALDGIIIHTYSKIEFESIKNTIKSILAKNGFSKDVISNIKPTSAYPFNI